MVSLAQIDTKLQNSFNNIKQDMDSFRNKLDNYSEKLSILEDKSRKTPKDPELAVLKEEIDSLKRN